MTDTTSGDGFGGPTKPIREDNVIDFAQRSPRKRARVARPSILVVDNQCRGSGSSTGHPFWWQWVGSDTGSKAVRGVAYSLPSAWEIAVEAWLVWLRLGGIRPTTLRLRRGHIRMIARRSRTRGPHELTLAMIVDISSAQSWSNEHRKGVRTSLNSFYDYCCQNGYAADNPAASLPKVAGETPRPRPCPDDIWLALLAAAPPRERMMARLAGEVGMRRAEVAVCHRRDLLRDVDGWSLLINGKGGRQRVVGVPDELADAIRAFCPGGYLFPGQIDGHVSAHHVGKLLSALMPAGWSMHKLRHRFATLGYAGTGDIMAVKDALGHASVATTQIYTAVPKNGVRAVSDAAAWHAAPAAPCHMPGPRRRHQRGEHLIVH